jgi:hypothetical protein
MYIGTWSLATLTAHMFEFRDRLEAKRWSMEDAAYNARLHTARRDAVMQERRARRKGRRKSARKGVQRAGAGEQGVVERAARAREEEAAARAAMVPLDSDEVARLTPSSFS